MPSETLQAEAGKVLEWGKLLEYLASYAQSTIGAEYCRTMELEEDLAQARIRQAETTDMIRLRGGTDPFPILRFPDVLEWLGRVAKGAAL